MRSLKLSGGLEAVQSKYSVGDWKTLSLDGIGDVPMIMNSFDGTKQKVEGDFSILFEAMFALPGYVYNSQNKENYNARSEFDYFENTILPAIPENIRNAIKDVTVTYQFLNNLTNNLTANTKLFVPYENVGNKYNFDHTSKIKYPLRKGWSTAYTTSWDSTTSKEAAGMGINYFIFMFCI